MENFQHYYFYPKHYPLTFRIYANDCFDFHRTHIFWRPANALVVPKVVSKTNKLNKLRTNLNKKAKNKKMVFVYFLYFNWKF